MMSPPGGGMTARPQRARSGPAIRNDARMGSVSSRGISTSGWIADAHTATVFSSRHSTCAPMCSSRRSIASTSLMCGMLRSTTSSSVRRQAASAGSAAFLFPAGTTVPESGYPPSIRSFCMNGEGLSKVLQCSLECDGALSRLVSCCSPPAARPARAGWAIATRYTGGGRKPNGLRRFRFARPVNPERTGLYYQPGYGWNPHSSYGFRGRAFLRDGRAVYLTRGTPRGFRLGRSRGPRQPGVRTIMGASSYRGRIAPGHTVRLDFVVPVVPVDRTSGAYQRIAVARFPHYRACVLGFWHRLLGRVMDVELPEATVVNALYSSIMNAATSRYQAGERWVQPVS